MMRGCMFESLFVVDESQWRKQRKVDRASCSETGQEHSHEFELEAREASHDCVVELAAFRRFCCFNPDVKQFLAEFFERDCQ